MSTLSFESLFEKKSSVIASRPNTVDEVMVKMQKVMHRNTNTTDSEAKKTNRPIGPKPPTPRDAMGEYIVPPGGKPLTSLCDGQPGPGAYDTPDIDATHERAPQFTIASRYRKQSNAKSAGPADYNTGQDLKWNRCRGFTFKGRLPERRVYNTPGPDTYLPIGTGVGECGPKYSLGLKDAVVGLQPLNQPTDVKGFETPGPNYLPERDQRSGFSFGGRLNRGDKSNTPGPAAYAPSPRNTGPAWTMSSKSKEEKKRQKSPGPNAYDLKTTIGTGLAKSILGPNSKSMRNEGASPASYYVRQPKTNIGVSMKYRPFEIPVDASPGPAAYKVEAPHCVRNRDSKSTTFNCRGNCCPAFPGSPRELRKATRTERMPGPDRYSNLNNFEKNCGPAYSFGIRVPDKTGDVPGPTLYGGRSLDTGPAYSMAGRRGETLPSENPGPAAYLPKEARGTREGYTIAGKPKPKEEDMNMPGPNAYNVTDGPCKNSGFSLKSRHSPWVYSGVRTIAVADKGGLQQTREKTVQNAYAQTEPNDRCQGFRIAGQHKPKQEDICGAGFHPFYVINGPPRTLGQLAKEEASKKHTLFHRATREDTPCPAEYQPKEPKPRRGDMFSVSQLCD
ncbi:uncharacterized protein LOC121368077 isoform X2 [Gigantopelta aegis]|uniref:uncharacterized protein LOC121368077 isoform X2 n=1 Tax=Gigantopelta aegis TaxID=1735272 RepID=UPI001B88A21E|nr:uncharacterized protein LOC121368077 isoform X2 [Gigantopelta aegis]